MANKFFWRVIFFVGGEKQWGGVKSYFWGNGWDEQILGGEISLFWGREGKKIPECDKAHLRLPFLNFDELIHLNDLLHDITILLSIWEEHAHRQVRILKKIFEQQLTPPGPKWGDDEREKREEKWRGCSKIGDFHSLVQLVGQQHQEHQQGHYQEAVA